MTGVQTCALPIYVETIVALAPDRVVVVEDCAQSLGASIHGRPVGTIGDMGVFSFGPKKHLPLGEGGMLVSNQRYFLERAIVAGQHPDRALLQVLDPRIAPLISEQFWGYRLNPIAAILGSVLITRHLEHWLSERARNIQQLVHQLARSRTVRLPEPLPGTLPARGGLALTFVPNTSKSSRSQYAEEVTTRGVSISLGPVKNALHLLPCVQQRWGGSNPCPVAEWRCNYQELFLNSTIGWIGNRTALAQQVGCVLDPNLGSS